jgi:hypothetical protein
MYSFSRRLRLQVPIALMRVQFWRDLLDKSYKVAYASHHGRIARALLCVV